jgi:peptidyl-tRNA hydrolase, PTH1 family
LVNTAYKANHRAANTPVAEVATSRLYPARVLRTMPAMRVILGIGNPGSAYERTRHNCGFLVLDELARRHALGDWSKRWNALVCDWRVPEALGGGRALLVKPQTYVNLSGESAQAVLAFHKLLPTDMLVVVDDLNLPLGHLRLRPDGSAGGHNGLKDIEARLGKAYPRLRVGIGRPAANDQVDHVLGAFSEAERDDLSVMLAKAADCVEGWLREGVAVACRFNGPSRPPPPVQPKAATGDTPSPDART